MFSAFRASSGSVLRRRLSGRWRLILCLSCLACTALWAGQQPAGSPGAEASRYAGPETCHACHDDAYQSFAASAHEKLLANLESAQQGCEACHGPGADHVNGNGDASKIFRFSEAKPAAIRSHCVACHTQIREDPHSRHDVTCLSCHSAHHYTQPKFILIKSEDSLCRGCHPPETNKAGQRR